MLNITKIFYLVFGVLTILGGIIGFVKAKSRASLIAGGICGAVLLLAGGLIFYGNVIAGLILGLLVTVALAGQFVPKVMLNRAPIHSIVMAILSALGLVFTLISFAKK